MKRFLRKIFEQPCVCRCVCVDNIVENTTALHCQTKFDEAVRKACLEVIIREKRAGGMLA